MKKLKSYYVVSILSALFLLSCQSIPSTSTAVFTYADRLFPLGIQYHTVTFAFKNGKKETVSGVLKLTDDDALLLGLSPFANTLFKVHEDFKTRKITIEIFQPEFEKARVFIEKFYEAFRKIIHLKAQDFKGDVPAELKLENGYHVFFKERDARGIFRFIEIRHDEITISIKVISYSF